MAPTGLFPRDAPRPTSSAAEHKLWHALSAQLPEGWVAWHSLRVRAPQGLDGEGDFVLAVPGRGAFVLEVKGGNVEVRDGRWWQDGRPLPKAPREQAFGYVEKLRRQLSHRFPDLRHPFFAVATAFPETDEDLQPPHGDVEGTVLTEVHLPYLREALPALVERLFKPIPAPDGPWIEALHELWGQTWVRDPSLGARTRKAAQRLLALDAEQLGALDAVAENPRVFVSGGPGSGKTVLAVELARRWRAAGRRPLLLCFTRALATELRESGLVAWTVRELAAEVLGRAGVALEAGAPPEAWSPATWNEVPLRAAAALPASPLEHDAVIVDEAQDLAPDDWAFVRAVAGAGPLWSFGDASQAFWSDRREIPADVRPFVFALKSRYRCPKGLAAFADGYRPEPAPPPGPVEGLRVLTSDPDALEARCDAVVERLVREGVAPHQIAVLSLGGRTRTRVGRAAVIGGVEAVRADDPEAHARLVSDTFLRFKGLERPWIVVTELGLGAESYDVRMHIALSRATVGCLVIATEEELAADGRLRGAAG
jgi:hypothetical protein